MRMNHSSKFWGIAATAVLLGASGIGHAGIKNTKHNLSNDGSSPGSLHTDTTEICIFCHTPHMTVAKGNHIPLWNHQVSTSADVVGGYTMYTSDTFNGSATAEALVAPGTPDKATVTTLCLSCHDGTVAINSVYNASNLTELYDTAGTAGQIDCTNVDSPPASWMADCKMPSTSNAALGTDLSNDHPVNFTYDTALKNADGSLHDPAGLTGVRLYNGTVQCASCHDPHIDYSDTTGDTSRTPFLRLPITGSTICLECHNK